MSSLHIRSMGRSIPTRIVTNDDMSRIVETDDEWIRTRTGICRRHFLEEGRTNTDQAIDAAREALGRSGVDPSEIGACIVATFAPDNFAPPTAACVHAALGLAPEAFCFDMNGACAGFIYALHVAKGLLLAEPSGKALVVASEFLSNVVDFTDRSTCVLFGDGAAAAVVELDGDGEDWFVGGTDGDTQAITCAAHVGPHPGIVMRGQDVFRFACSATEDDLGRLLELSGLALEDIDHVVCHQANARIINHVIRHLDADPARFYLNVAEYGNTSAASIAIALCEMEEKGLLERGQYIMTIGFGAGLVHGGMLLRW